MDKTCDNSWQAVYIREQIITERKLIKTYLDSSILNLLGNLVGKQSLHLVFLISKIWMMPRIALDTYPPTLFRHSKNKCPAFFRIKVGVRQHQEALVAVQFDVLLQVVEDLASMELFHFGVSPYSC